MWRYRTSFAAGLALLLCGCAIISFEKLTVTVWPYEPDAVLAAAASPWVEFPDSPDRPSVQRLLTLSSPDGQVSGDFRWDGNRMYFDPVPTLRPGVRYVFAYRGRVTLENGQAFDADEEVPFYVGHTGPGPGLLSSDPSDGEIVAIDRPLVLSFSTPVDANSFSREFDLQPSMETIVNWDVAGRVVTITPRDEWANLATYTWKTGKDMAAPDGTPIGIEYGGRFRVQEDSTAPMVTSIVPGIRATLSPTGNDLDHTSADDALLFNFSEDIRMDSLSSALTSTPMIKGTLLRVSMGVYALIPEAHLVMDQRYTLRIAETVADLSGNKMGLGYERSFTPDIPLQTVQFIKAVYAATEDEWTIFNTLDAKPVSIDVTGTLKLEIQFAEAFSLESRANLVSAILLDGFFPSSLADPSLVSVVWTGTGVQTLTLIYGGLQKSTSEVGRYYKLLLPGGAASSDNGAGSFLKEDVWLYFYASP
jgi:hypothetical protein